MAENPTHAYAESPRIGLRYLANYMAATERGRRRIILDSKYRPLGRVIQHAEAVSTVSKFIQERELGVDWLKGRANDLRRRMADSDFDRDLYDHNADYISRFASVVGDLDLPKRSQLLPPGPTISLVCHGVRITIGLHARLHRLTRTNKTEEGGAMLRYAKGKALQPEPAAWQSAFILGYLNDVSTDQDVTPHRNLCITIDAYTGKCHPAPGNSVSRYQNMKAACLTIAERWPNIAPPDGAIF